MNTLRALGVITGSVALALAFAACGSKTTVNNQPTETSGITVSGHGEVQVPPDIAYITMGVQTTATTVADARESAAKAADALVSSVKKNGVDAKDVQTSGLYIQPNYEYSSKSPTLTGYTVTNTVTVKVRKLDNISKILDDAIAAGGDAARLQGLTFSVDDADKAKQDAREKAMADAKARAEQLARLGGVSLGAPVTISETQGSVNPIARDTAGVPTLSGGTSTPVETGTNKVTVDVSVRWAIK
jgi:uncharacterized protein YggE